MITLDHVSKKFDKRFGVRDITTEIPSGCVCGLVGSNGSGKSTLLRLIAGIYRPNKGGVAIDGAPVFEQPGTKERMFYISDDQYTDRHSSIAQMAQWYTRIYPNYDKKLALDMAERFGLDAKAPFKTFSKGMQRQAHIILGLAAKPAVLLCDETFDGLDPVKRRAVKNIFSELVMDVGTTVVIASHNLRELEDICDHVGIMHEGTMLLERALSDLQDNIVKVQLVSDQPLPDTLQILHKSTLGRVQTLIIRGNPREVSSVLAAGAPLLCDLLPLSLEEIFIYELGGTGYDVKNLVL